MAYATTTDLAEYLHIIDESELTSNDERLLDRASDLVESFILRNYDSEDEVRAAAATKATCAQVEYWRINGETDIEPSLKSKQVGKKKVEFAGESSRGGGLCSRAVRVLNLAGLLYAGVTLR